MNFEDPLTVVYLGMSAANILFMQAGFSMLETGCVRAKNSKSILFKTMAGFTIGVIVWWLFGFGLAGHGASGQLASAYFADWKDFTQVSYIHSMSFATASCTIISGAVTERIRFHAYLVFSVINIGIIYAVIVNWTWSENGWLYQFGFKDFAGSGVVHLCGGVSALVGSYILGPRLYRFNQSSDGKVEVMDMPGHSPVISSIGVYILVIGWLSFNGSSTLSADLNGVELATRAMSNTILSGAVSGCVGVIINQLVHGTHDLSAFHNSFLSGMVGITAASAHVSSLSSVIIGIISAFVNQTSSWLVLCYQIDDVVDAFSVHGSPGLWGILATGLFAEKRLIEQDDYGLLAGSNGWLLWYQVVGGLVIIAWSGSITAIVFLVMKHYNWLRVDPDDELLGLDFMDHEGGAWPEFSQLRVQESKDYKMAEKRLADRGDVRRRRRVKKMSLPTWPSSPCSSQGKVSLSQCVPWFKNDKVTPYLLDSKDHSKTSIIMIGGGVIGLSIAHQLSPSCNVTVIDKSMALTGASCYGGGLISNCSIESERVLCQASFNLHAEMSKKLNGAANYGYRTINAYHVNMIPNDDGQVIEPAAAAMIHDDVSWMDGSLHASVSKLDLTGGACIVHPRLYTQTLKSKCIEKGVKFVHAEVKDIVRDETGKVIGVKVNRNGEDESKTKLFCDVAVIATGFIPKDFDEIVGRKITYHTQLCTCRVYQSSSLVSDGCAIGSALPPSTVYLKCQESNLKEINLAIHIQVNGSILVCNTGDADDASILTCLQKLSSVFVASYTLQEKHACQMSLANDGLPVISELSRGLYSCVGFGYCGFELAPVTAAILQKMVEFRGKVSKAMQEIEAAHGVDASKYSIDRFNSFNN